MICSYLGWGRIPFYMKKNGLFISAYPNIVKLHNYFRSPICRSDVAWKSLLLPVISISQEKAQSRPDRGRFLVSTTGSILGSGEFFNAILMCRDLWGRVEDLGFLEKKIEGLWVPSLERWQRTQQACPLRVGWRPHKIMMKKAMHERKLFYSVLRIMQK